LQFTQANPKPKMEKKLAKPTKGTIMTSKKALVVKAFLRRATVVQTWSLVLRNPPERKALNR